MTGRESIGDKYGSENASIVEWIGWLYWHSMKSTGFSWTRLNGALREALNSAIVAGVKFDPDDFKSIFEKFKGHFWFAPESTGEIFYGSACRSYNISAAISFEFWKSRPPILYEGKRLAIGDCFFYEDKEYRINSLTMRAATMFINAGHYRDKRGIPCDKMQKRLTVSIEDFRAVEATKRKLARDSKKAENKKQEQLA